MDTTLYLFACALAIAQPVPAESPDSILPNLARGQELYYRGSYTEEAGGAGVQFQRSYQLENRVFVLGTNSDGAEIACLTIWKTKGASEAHPEADTSSVRLELGRVDKTGKATANAGSNWLAPLDGPPMIECGMFVPLPGRHLTADEKWDVGESGRPLRAWTFAGTENVGGARCVKLVGVQQSEDWESPRADQAAWRRQDTVWLTPRGGYAAKVERVIERREPAHRRTEQRLVVKYELESSMQYPGRLYEDRRKDITQIETFSQQLADLLPRAGNVGSKPFEAILQRVQHHIESQSPTPYREAIRNVERLAEAGMKGERPPTVPSGDPPRTAAVATVGGNAPDFLATDLSTHETARLRHWIGQPVLLVFFKPGSSLGEDVLRFAQELAEQHRGQLQVVGMAFSDDTEAAVKLKTAMKLPFPVVAGSGMRISYGVDATPKLVVIDGNGVIRASYTGWGPEASIGVKEELQHCQEAGQEK